MSVAIRLDDVSYVYSPARRRKATEPGDRPAARGLEPTSLHIGSGQFVAVAGPNGSGKSTLLRLLATELTPQSGTLELFGEAINTRQGRIIRAIRRQLGVVMAEPALDPVLTIEENLSLSAALYTEQNVSTRISDILGRLTLTERAGDRVGSLSTGLRRRADLARAILHQPKLLLLDEPTAGLDAESQRTFLDAIDKARTADGDLTVVMVSHDNDELRTADRVLLFEQGKVVIDDTPSALERQLGAFVADVHDQSLKHQLSSLGFDPRPTSEGLIVSITDRTAADRLFEAAEIGAWAVSIRRPALRDAAALLRGHAATISRERHR